MFYFSSIVIFLFSLLTTSVFSFMIFTSDNLFMTWFYMELCTLSLVPCFMLGTSTYKLSSLFSYIVVLTFCSCLYVMGCTYLTIIFFIFFCLFVKFGLFPFCSWIYHVVVYSNWFVILIFSLIFKCLVVLSSFIFFGSFSCYYISAVSCCFTLLYCGLMFWVFTYSWFHCWGHMMLSSSSILLLLSVSNAEGSLFYLYVFYILWGLFSMVFLYCHCHRVLPDTHFSFILYVFLLLNTPFSLSFYYKVFLSFNMTSLPLIIWLFWFFYSFLEQYYLYSYLFSCSVPKKVGGWHRFV